MPAWVLSLDPDSTAWGAGPLSTGIHRLSAPQVKEHVPRDPCCPRDAVLSFLYPVWSGLGLVPRILESDAVLSLMIVPTRR